MTRCIRFLALIVGGATLVPSDARAAARPTVDQVLAHLAQNTSVLRTITFTVTITTTNARTDRPLSRTSRVVVRVAVDLRNLELEQELLEPPLGSLGSGEKDEGRDKILLHCGLPAQIMDPVGSMRGYRLTMAATAPAGHVVLSSQPGMAPPGPFPRTDWLVDTTRNRLVSVTVYVGTGEVVQRTGFESHVEFLGGQVVMPTRVTIQEFARLNRIESWRAFDAIVVTTSGRTPPTTGSVKEFIVDAPGRTFMGVSFSATVTALGIDGKVLTSFRGTVEFTSTDPLAGLPGEYRFRKQDEGRHVFSLTLGTQGGQVVTVQSGKGGNGPATSVLIDVLPAQEYIVVRGASSWADLDFYGSASGWAVGSTTSFSEPLVLRYDGIGWTRVEISVPSDCPYWSSAGVGLSDPATGWLVAAGGGCADVGLLGLRYPIGGGSVGTPEPMPPLTAPTGLTLVSPADGWLGAFKCTDSGCVAGVGEVFRFDGSQWVLVQELGFNETLGQFRFPRGLSLEGWAIGTSQLYRFQESWGQWQLTDQPGALSLWMNSGDDVWAGSVGAALWHFDGAGWSLVPIPADPHFAIAGIAFLDSHHGVAVGFLSGFLQVQLPVVVQYADGVWQPVPVALPAGFHNLRLLGVRMTSPTDAWAIASGLDIEGNVLDQPVLAHLHLPAVSIAGSAEAAASARVASLGAMGGPRIRRFEVTATPTGGRRVELGFGVTSPCEAELMIFSDSMRQVWSRTMDVGAADARLSWDAKTEGGEPIVSGWYTAALAVRNAWGSAAEIRRFRYVRPQMPAVALRVPR